MRRARQHSLVRRLAAPLRNAEGSVERGAEERRGVRPPARCIAPKSQRRLPGAGGARVVLLQPGGSFHNASVRCRGAAVPFFPPENLLVEVVLRASNGRIVHRYIGIRLQTSDLKAPSFKLESTQFQTLIV